MNWSLAVIFHSRSTEMHTWRKVWGLKPLLVPNSAWETVMPRQQGWGQRGATSRYLPRKESQHDLSPLE